MCCSGRLTCSNKRCSSNTDIRPSWHCRRRRRRPCNYMVTSGGRCRIALVAFHKLNRHCQHSSKQAQQFCPTWRRITFDKSARAAFFPPDRLLALFALPTGFIAAPSEREEAIGFGGADLLERRPGDNRIPFAQCRRFKWPLSSLVGQWRFDGNA